MHGSIWIFSTYTVPAYLELTNQAHICEETDTDFAVIYVDGILFTSFCSDATRYISSTVNGTETVQEMVVVMWWEERG